MEIQIPKPDVEKSNKQYRLVMNRYLSLRPRFNHAQSRPDANPPLPAGQPDSVRAGNELVKEPHVDGMKELGEELDGERSVNATPTQQGHGGREHMQDVVCRSH